MPIVRMNVIRSPGTVMCRTLQRHITVFNCTGHQGLAGEKPLIQAESNKLCKMRATKKNRLRRNR